jgi:hypothetical protein
MGDLTGSQGFDSLPLFADIPGDFNPEVDWLDGSSPDHPFFDNHSDIQSIIHSIKGHLLHNVFLGCKAILGKLPQPQTQGVSTLRRSLDEKPELWKAIISAQKYGVVYLISRSDARQQFWPLVQENPVEADEIDAYLREDATAIRAINYAVYRLVTKGVFKVDNPTRFVPPNAISCVGGGHIAVRKGDFEKSIEEILGNPNPLYDLHDFAHLTVATLSPELFGNKYFSDLVKLDSSFTALIRSPGMKTGRGIKISDGILFSEFLTELFTHEVEATAKQQKSHTYRSLAETMARMLADYLIGCRALKHCSTRNMIEADKPITPTQLAVLVQNKAYELTASEIEQRFFTRGGSEGDGRDLLDTMMARQRIEYLATSKSWLYFEVRNTVKHRAHKEAYRMVAMHYLEKGVEADLCRKILENLTYKDWRRGERLNLWSFIAQNHNITVE